MRRFILSMFSMMILAVTHAQAPIFLDKVGSYSIYNDLRFETQAYIGLAFIGSDTLVLRSYEPKSMNELILMIQFVKTADNIDIGPKMQILKGRLGSSPAADRLLPMVMNWARTWYDSRYAITENIKYETTTDDDFRYEYWIPVFQLRAIVDGDNTNFSLITAGILKDFEDQRFFSFANLPSEIDAESFVIDPKPTDGKTIDGLNIPLDSNWKTNDDRTFRIQVRTDQDAFFSVETLDLEKISIPDSKTLAKRLLLSNKDIILITDGTVVGEDGDHFFFSMRMLDPRTMKITYQECAILRRGGTVVSLAILASFETVYRQNAAYFKAILH